jgi:pimeloyl-ACP methyl ester carboxylesterase
MTASTANQQFELFRAYGCDVWIPDYVGYGESTGEASEIGCRHTADAVYHHLTERLRIPPGQIIAAGWALGVAVAIDLAFRNSVAGLIALSPFTSIEEIAKHMLRIPIPLGSLIRDRFDNLAKISSLRCGKNWPMP